MGRRSHRFRLTGPSDFEAIFRRGARCEGVYLQMIFLTAARECGRVGFVMAKKALPRAVDRNRVRRMLRAVVQETRPAIEAYDLVIRLKKATPRNEFRRISEEAARMLTTIAAGGRQ